MTFKKCQGPSCGWEAYELSGTSSGPAFVGVAKNKTVKQKTALRMMCFMFASIVYATSQHPSMVTNLGAGDQVRCDARHKNHDSRSLLRPHEPLFEDIETTLLSNSSNVGGVTTSFRGISSAAII